MSTYQDPECTIFVGNIDQRVKPELLWELFLQAGPLRNVHIPTDRSTGKQKKFGFVTYKHEISVKYACELFNLLKVFDRPIYCNPNGEKGRQTPNQTPQSQERRSSNCSFNRNNSIERPHSQEQSPQNYYQDVNSRQDSFQRQSLYNNQNPRYPDNQTNRDFNVSSGNEIEYGLSRRQDFQQRNNQPYPGLHHSLSSPANLNFSGNSPLFMRAVNQFPNRSIPPFNSSPFHDSPSHHGPVRNDHREKNYQHSRMNRRQQNYPY